VAQCTLTAAAILFTGGPQGTLTAAAILLTGGPQCTSTSPNTRGRAPASREKWGRPRRDGCRGDDLLLLTQRPAPAGGAAEAWPPALHLLALVERVERLEGRRGARGVQAVVSLQAGASGAPPHGPRPPPAGALTALRRRPRRRLRAAPEAGACI